MDVFLLHSGEKELDPLLPHLTIAHGDRLPQAYRGEVVIGWGKYRKAHATGLHPYVQMQPLMPMIRNIQLVKRDEILLLHGVKTLRSHGGMTQEELEQYEGAQLSHYYRVSVFGLEPISVYRRKNRGVYYPQRTLPEPLGFEEVDLQESPLPFHINRAMREAVKTIYVLGLDYGDVWVGITSNGHTVIIDVNAEPDLTLDRNAEVYAQAMNRYADAWVEEKQNKQSFLLGADPEFLLMNEQGKVVAASNYMERAGEVGCDAIVLRGQRLILPLAELRPEPSAEPRELVRNLRRTMLVAAEIIDNQALKWIAGGMPVKGFPLGGHIHFSGVMLQSSLLRTLDNYLALPLFMIENDLDLRRRPRYGSLGDFRRQPHGGFEYRTLPSWLGSPTVTKGVLALAKLIGLNHRRLQVRPLDQVDVQRHFYQGKKDQLVGYVQKLWQELELLPDYERYSTYLEPLKDRTLNRKEMKSLDDFRKHWKINPSKTSVIQ
ncbi:hypothetical protein NV379_03050 [Paenibacillus sp. N1-5-1-14]|nr:hypothetical protein [Paenibacillus radicibacter]